MNRDAVVRAFMDEAEEWQRYADASEDEVSIREATTVARVLSRMGHRLSAVPSQDPIGW